MYYCRIHLWLASGWRPRSLSMGALRVICVHRLVLRDACPRVNHVLYHSKPSQVSLHLRMSSQCSLPCLGIRARTLATFTPNHSSEPGGGEKALSRQKKSFLSRFLPPSLVSPENAGANLRKIIALGRPEKNTLIKAVGLVCLLSPLELPLL